MLEGRDLWQGAFVNRCNDFLNAPNAVGNTNYQIMETPKYSHEAHEDHEVLMVGTVSRAVNISATSHRNNVRALRDLRG